MNKLLAVAAAPLLALALASPAHATGAVAAHTEVTWGGGTSCIQTRGPQLRNPYLESVPTWQCSAVQSLTWDEFRYPGQYVGVDPIMGDAAWISCDITVYGSQTLTYSDYASAGDGTDVSCLRTVH